MSKHTLEGKSAFRALAVAVLGLVWAMGYTQTATNHAALWELARTRTAEAAKDKKALQLWSYATRSPLRQVFPNGKIRELVRWADGWRLIYETCNLDADKAINVDDVWAGGSEGLSLSGSGVTLGVWDGGSVRTTHQEFGGRVVSVDGAALSGHGTHVGGTMVAAGVTGAAKGGSFAASLRSFDWNSDAAEMASEAATGLRISNHSYASYYDNYANWNYGFYDPEAQTWDQMAFDAPFYLIVKAASNDQAKNTKAGFDTIPTSGNAKNVLTIGAVMSMPAGYTTPSSVVMTNFSSWGPTDDGRIKPDVVADGDNLYSTYHTNNTAYAYSSGTSMATPSASGALGLLVQHRRNLYQGQDMRASTLKALVIATANEAGPADGPDYKFGWGLINVSGAAKVLTDNVATPGLIVEDSVTTGETKEYQFTSTGASMRVAIVWTDRPGTPPTFGVIDPPDLMLVNDLDVRVNNNGTTWSPWTLNPASPSTAAVRGDNVRDNVERIDVSAPVAGTVTVSVASKGTLTGGSQAFSLVVVGLTPGAGTVTLTDLAVSPASVVGGDSSTGTVTLSSAAPAGGVLVTLGSSNSPVANVPANVLVPEGQSTANFSVTTSDVAAPTNVTLTASLSGHDETAVLNVAPAPKVSGVCTLGDFGGNKTLVPLSIEIRSPGSTIPLETSVAQMNSTGAFAVRTYLPAGTYDVAVKASHWLRKVVRNVVFGSTGASGLSVSLVNGDVNGDNTVNLTDLTAISRAWRTAPGNPLWNPEADLNGDGAINLTDKNIVSRNWRLRGDS